MTELRERLQPGISASSICMPQSSVDWRRTADWDLLLRGSEIDAGRVRGFRVESLFSSRGFSAMHGTGCEEKLAIKG